MDNDRLILLIAILSGLASITSIALALISGYDRARSAYWDWVVRQFTPLEYAWAAAQFSHTARSGIGALPPNATLDGGPQASEHGIFGPAINSLRGRRWYRGRLIQWRRDENPDAAGNRPWLCVLHPEVYRRTRGLPSEMPVYR